MTKTNPKKDSIKDYDKLLQAKGNSTKIPETNNW